MRALYKRKEVNEQMAFRMKYNANFSISRVVAKITLTIIALWVGGTIITEIGNVMLCTSSAFYDGLTLIGWTISDNYIHASEICTTTVVNGTDNVITATTGSGVLAVVGIIGIASIVLEFVRFKTY